MRSAFISYSLKDEAKVIPYENRLKTLDIAVWRDKSGLRQGQLWPMRLGEAIAEQDVLLLFWSANAAASHFVTLEWNTAIALKKTLIPVLLDEQPLPNVLKPYHCFTDVSQLSTHVLSLIPAQQPPQNQTLLTELKAAQEDAGQALDIVKHHIQQHIQQDNWRVGGNVYQVQGDLHIGSSGQGDSSWPNRWSLWLGILAALLTIIALAFDIPTKFAEAFPGFMPKETKAITTAGLVQDENGNPLADVSIQLPELGVQTQTNAAGRFTFTLQPDQQKLQSSRLIAQKAGYTTWNDYVTLGDPAFNFSLHKE
ncbi:TIR domain-containing protein [Thiothrix nivea]|uniref:TIR domain-containing protein n=1 Tax=Thiothrix nivea (strain ATCC 35100 / DSM 5205 / JP2) TaxID=870187 RepID=A0A656HGG5_THINJ|nr:TIR domain-containing protein [Thiothrix nivea]EIJ35998.1 hypothetical protein Thini_3486 [Thiothrix nivea DSM 5205]